MHFGFGELDGKVHLVQFHLKSALYYYVQISRLEIGLGLTYLDLVRLEIESVSLPPSSVLLSYKCQTNCDA